MKPWINHIARAVQIVLSIAMGMASFYLACLGMGTPSTAVVIMWLLVLMAIAVHELGHVAGARLYGMTVWRMNISGLEFRSQRRGWRVRRSPIPHRRIRGFVQAFPLFGQPIRPQLISLTLGGPLGNLTMAILCGAGGWLLLPRHAAFLWLCWAAVNLGVALINMIPHQGALPSDGLSFLRLLRGVDENSPGHIQMRLISRSFAGQTADQLPEDEVALLEQQPAPLPIIALWYRLKADQNRGDWVSAEARRAQFEAMEQALVPEQKPMLGELMSIVWAEMAFTRAMLTADVAELSNNTLTAEAAWSLPWLQPRCQALVASLRGDQAQCIRLLETSRLKAENSVDKAVWSSEALMRHYVAAASGERRAASGRLAIARHRSRGLMFKRKLKELPVPPAAKHDRDAVELARVWAANGDQHVSLSPELWDDPATWGIVLVDLARHVTNFYVQERGMDREAVLARIKTLLEAEWDTPTSDVVGEAIH